MERPSLISKFLPALGEWWDMAIGLPWLGVAVILLSLLSIRRHGELAYGSYHPLVIGILLPLFYLSSQLLLGIVPTNIGLLGLLLTVLVSDSVVIALSQNRSPFFIYNIGLVLGLLFVIHPATVAMTLLVAIWILSERKPMARYGLALLGGIVTVLSLSTMLFATRSWEGVWCYWQNWLAPLSDLHLPPIKALPHLATDTLYLAFSTVAVFQTSVSTTVRVRTIMRYHIQLAWLLMLLHLIYGMQGEGQFVFWLSTLFLTSTIVDYILSLKRVKWLLIPLTLLLILSIGVKLWLYQS